MMCGRPSVMMLDRAAPSQPRDHKFEQDHWPLFCSQTAILIFTLSTVFSKSHKVFHVSLQNLMCVR